MSEKGRKTIKRPKSLGEMHTHRPPAVDRADVAAAGSVGGALDGPASVGGRFYVRGHGQGGSITREKEEEESARVANGENK